MRKHNKILSLLIVLFIVGVNALTACGQNTVIPRDELESTVVSELSKGMEKTTGENEDHSIRADSESNAKPDQSQHKQYQSESQDKEENPPAEKKEPTTKIQEPVLQTVSWNQGQISAPVNTPVPFPAVSWIAYEDPFVEENVGSEEEPNDIEVTIPNEPEWDSSAEQLETEAERAVEPVIQHTHSYSAVLISPTCLSGGYTLYTCACGDSYKVDETPALGHDWASKTERVRVRQEAHEICGDCAMDLTANGIVGAAIAQHAKQHVMADESATGRTFTSLIDVYDDVISSQCIRCGKIR